MTRVPLAVTTSGRPEGLIDKARAAASAWGLPFIPRPRSGTTSALLDTAAEALIVFGRDSLGGETVVLVDREGTLGFTGGMGHLRRLRLRNAEQSPDAFIRVAELRPGDAVLDCTLGLASDALVTSLVVGPSGRVVGLEKSLPLYAVVSEGLRRYDLGPDSCRIETVRADAHTFLQAQPSGSFDVVFFDPMFARPRKAQPAFEVLRRYAEHAPLTPETLEEGRRVARRWVVVKGARYSDDLRKLGLLPEPGPRTADIVWGRIAGLGSQSVR
ncbi:class I SAM-dependent methyltransferase [Myxococcaceae bacterium GXIMD 01537]